MLTRLVLKNFKGVQNLSTTLENVNEFQGENATGKTTVLDAVLWCLTGKDHKGRSDYDIKTRIGEEVQHNLDHTVEAYFTGFALRRIYKEKWVKKHGNINKILSGHVTDYAIDAGAGFVDQKKKDYDFFISENFGDENDVLMCVDPFHFSEAMHWADRRKIVLGSVEGKSDEDVANEIGVDVALIAGDPNETRKSLKKSLRKTEEDQSALQTRVDENQLSVLKPVDKGVVSKTIDEISKKEDVIQKTLEEVVNADYDKFQTALQKEKDAISAIDRQEQPPELQQKRDLANKLVSQRTAESDSSFNSAVQFNTELNNAKGVIERESRNNHDEKLKINRTLGELKGEYDGVVATKFEGDTTCPTCAQELPIDKIEGIKSTFNQNRVNKIKSINERAKDCNARLDAINKVVFEKIATKELVLPVRYIKANDPEVAEILTRITELEQNMIDASASSEKAKEPHTAKIQTLTDAYEADKLKIEERKKPLREEIKEFQELQKAEDLKLQKSASATKRIDELMIQIRDLETTFTEISQKIDAIDRFIEAKINALEADIFDKFGVHFQMFKYTQDGAPVEMCEVLVQGKNSVDPFPSANNGAQIHTGVIICAVLQEMKDIDLPIIIDNVESVTTQIESTKQTILLRVVKGKSLIKTEN